MCVFVCVWWKRRKCVNKKKVFFFFCVCQEVECTKNHTALRLHEYMYCLSVPLCVFVGVSLCCNWQHPKTHKSISGNVRFFFFFVVCLFFVVIIIVRKKCEEAKRVRMYNRRRRWVFFFFKQKMKGNYTNNKKKKRERERLATNLGERKVCFVVQHQKAGLQLPRKSPALAGTLDNRKKKKKLTPLFFLFTLSHLSCCGNE